VTGRRHDAELEKVTHPMTERPPWLIERAMERLNAKKPVCLPAPSRENPDPFHLIVSPVPNEVAGDDATLIAGPPMHAGPIPANRNEPLPPRLRSAILWIFGLGWLALVLAGGANFVRLSGERTSVSTAAPSTVTPAAPAPPAVAPKAATLPAIVSPAVAAPAPAAAAATEAAATATTDAAQSVYRGDDLVALGNDLLWTGDIATARLYFERAAEAGNAHAALLVGETYDGPLLSKLGVRGMRGDPQEATRWYERARDLGDADAVKRLVGSGNSK